MSGCDGLASSSSWKTVRIPNRLPRTANEPTAATAAPAAEAPDAPTSSRSPRASWRPEKRERRDHEDVRDGHREAGLDEDLQPVAAANGDDPGQAPDQDVRGVLEGGVLVEVQRSAQERDRDHHDRRHTRIEQDREQDPGRRRRDDERQCGTAGRRLQRDRRADEDQADQEQRVVAVPVLGSEAPDPAEDEADDEDRQEEPAAQPGDVRPRVPEAEMVDRLELELADLLAPLNDRLVRGELDHERLDEVGPLGALLLGQRRAEG